MHAIRRCDGEQVLDDKTAFILTAKKYNMSEDRGLGDEREEWQFAIPTQLTIVLGMPG